MAIRAADTRRGKTLYLDCQAGIAGDMLVAALLDLGGKPALERLTQMLEKLSLEGFSVSVTRVKKAGIDCCDFDVKLDAAHENHDHDMAYLHGLGDTSHDHDHHHAHRGLAQVEQVIDAASLSDRARGLARDAFRILARAEAKAHGLPIDQVHFHEVGAVDSIVDVLAAAFLIDDLDIERAIVPALTDGHGTIRCQHGVIPVPVPATLNICIAHGLPLSSSSVEGELVTPTGAALVAALEPEFSLPERYTIRAVGLGAGKRSYERPSILRAMLIEELDARVGAAAREPRPSLSAETQAPNCIVKLECDIDDCSPEVLAYAAERLREAGAREVHWLPIFCKKGRPAYQLQVIVEPSDVLRMEEIILSETTTIGIRRQQMERTCLPRAIESVETPWGDVLVKTVRLPDGTRRTTPEYEACAAIARDKGVALQTVMDTVREAVCGR
ncbi:nickel pincer cofactor biosynthesis protein LarC [Collinsella bouchesdurhonensis]|uniref:nickel pincer cofactor biosynthesis protein LarC n=1 Tax=Collinsella bouchesdurhonensis TaxID=1907654 RepID=UPI00096AC624|nr:nickel pincer cofactor biosynthesis protein LarC [Collinsella bouchesdurhonensis]